MNFRLRRLIRSRLCMGLLSVVFIALSINVAPIRCRTAKTGVAHKDLSRINQILSLGHVSAPQIPSGNHCRCSPSMAVCCKGAIKEWAGERYVALQNRDTTSPFGSLPVSLITPFFYIPSRPIETAPQNPFLFCQEKAFLINCSFLI